MPTYEYRCKSCDHGFEIVQSFTEDALTTCPECSGRLRKVFGNVGISFKGSGFYKTDSRSTSGGSGSSGSSSSDSSSSTTSSDSRSDTASAGSGSSDGGSSSSDSGSSEKASTSS